jgi:TonB family protein
MPRRHLVVALAGATLLPFATARAQMANVRRPFVTGVCTVSDSLLNLDALVVEPETAAELLSAVSMPMPPAQAHAAGFEAKVVVAFIVDTTGVVRAGTTAVMSSTDAELSRWACDAVPQMRFTAARDHGRAVATQVMMPFSVRVPVAVSAEATNTGPYLASQVDKEVVITHNVVPEFPAALKNDQQRGEVVARFVVDVNGRVDMDTFEVVSSTDPRFVQAVRDAVSLTRFVPAELGGRKVKQVVQVPFIFAVRNAPSFNRH